MAPPRGIVPPQFRQHQFQRKSGAPAASPAHPSLAAAFHEEKINPPAILAQTARKFGKARANDQRVAIAYSKARQSRRPNPDPEVWSAGTMRNLDDHPPFYPHKEA